MRCRGPKAGASRPRENSALAGRPCRPGASRIRGARASPKPGCSATVPAISSRRRASPRPQSPHQALCLIPPRCHDGMGKQIVTANGVRYAGKRRQRRGGLLASNFVQPGALPRRRRPSCKALATRAASQPAGANASRSAALRTPPPEMISISVSSRRTKRMRSSAPMP